MSTGGVAVLSAFAGGVVVKAFADITLDALKQRRTSRLRSVRKARSALEIALDNPALTEEQRQKITEAVSNLDPQELISMNAFFDRQVAKRHTKGLTPEPRDEVASQLVADIGAR